MSGHLYTLTSGEAFHEIPKTGFMKQPVSNCGIPKNTMHNTLSFSLSLNTLSCSLSQICFIPFTNSPLTYPVINS